MSSQETFSITTLQRMCARSEYLDESDIHMNDKTVSWDGNIIYYKTKKPASTGNEFLIPIQVKGKEYNILPDSDSISYPVDINDLKNYLKNGGVIFFVDAISKTEYNDKMYAKILLPVDIVHIMKWQLRSSVNQKELFEQMNYSLSLLGNGAAILLIVIGLINFIIYLRRGRRISPRQTGSQSLEVLHGNMYPLSENGICIYLM